MISNPIARASTSVRAFNTLALRQHCIPTGNNIRTCRFLFASSSKDDMFFTFPEDARWNSERDAVEFGVSVGEYEGLVSVPRQVFRRFIDGSVTPERCIEAYHLQRTRFERIAERKLRNLQLTNDANVEITGRDLARAQAHH